MRRFPFLFTLAFVLACAAAHAAGPLSRGPYLQQATPDSIVVVWRTQGETAPVLRYGATPDALTAELKGDGIGLRVSADVQAPPEVARLYVESAEDAAKRKGKDEDPSTPANTRQYEAHVKGLQPETKYFYGVYDGDTLLAGGDSEHYFVTYPPVGSESHTRFWVVGDSGTGEKDQVDVHTAMRNYVAETKRPLDYYLHVGDMAYGKGTDGQFQDHFFVPYADTLQNTVCWASMGNHEGGNSRGIAGTGPYFDAYVCPTAAEAGGVPSGSEAYYSFDIADAHFICLDSHDLDRSPDAAMAQWLRADLEKTKAKWLIAFWHHPPYTKGSHDSDKETQLIEMRENFMPILESAGVDLTLTGHSHIYERSMLIDGAYATPTVAENVVLDDGDGNPDGDGAYRKSEGLHPNEGAVAVVTGNGGANMSRKGTMPVMRQIFVEYGSVIIDIDGDTLKGIMLNKDGETRDLFSIVKKGTVTPKRIEKPWQPKNDLAQFTSHALNFAGDVPGAVPANWKIVQGESGAAAVVLDEDGKRRHLAVKAGDSASIGLFEPVKYGDFDLETLVRLPVQGESASGLVFAYVDDKNYSKAVFDTAADLVRVSRVADGQESVLLEQPATLEAGKWLQLVCSGRKDALKVNCLDGVKFEVPLKEMLPEGQMGYFVAPKSQAEFLGFQIKRPSSE